MELIKDSIRDLKEYKPSNIAFQIKLDANEGKNILLEDLNEAIVNFNKNLNINFYPDNDAIFLKKAISEYLNVNISNIVVGNGSSEMIELIIKTFVDKDESIMSFIPTFGMYSVFSRVYSAQFIGVQSDEDFSIDMEKLINKANELNPKIIFLCNPNNPTGYLINKKDIISLLNNAKGLVVIDEAYIEFADESMINEIANYGNLIVLRTFSKAFGLAGIRVGYMVADGKIINFINKVRAPYNLNSISQYISIKSLENKDKIFKYVEEVKKEREILYKELNNMGMKAYKSFGNFVLFKSNIKDLFEKLANKGILIRDFSKEINSCYRVSVGDKYENIEFIKSLKEIIANEKC